MAEFADVAMNPKSPDADASVQLIASSDIDIVDIPTAIHPRLSPIFLGVCQSALILGDGVFQDFLSVGEILPLQLYPQNLEHFSLLMAFPKPQLESEYQTRILLRDPESCSTFGYLDLKLGSVSQTGAMNLTGYSKHYKRAPSDGKYLSYARGLYLPEDARYKLMPVPCPPMVLHRPCRLEVFHELDGNNVKLGSFTCSFVKPPPLSAEERAALLSRPGSLRAIIFGLSCKLCSDSVRFFDSLEPTTSVPKSHHDAIPLSKAEALWICRCKKTIAPLCYLKDGVSEIYRRGYNESELQRLNVSAIHFQNGAIDAIISEYQECLSRSKDDEQTVQQFLEANPVLWNFLAPTKIWHKPPILTKYFADFAILSASNILHLIEIEKPSTKLVRKDGNLHSELNLALDQLRNWRIEVQNHRLAFLDQLNLQANAVHDIRFVLVAGMTSNTAWQGLEKVRRDRTAADSLFCFDELASFLHSTQAAIRNLQ